MNHRIEVAKLPGYQTQANILKKQIKADLSIVLKDIFIIDIYMLKAPQLSPADINRAAEEIFCDPVTENYLVDEPLAGEMAYDFIAEIGFKKGVKDNMADTSKDALADMFPFLDREKIIISTARQYIFKGINSKTDLENIIINELGNPLINRWNIHQKTSQANITSVFLSPDTCESASEPVVSEISLNSSVSDIMKISQENHLFLSVEEIQTILSFYAGEDFQSARQVFGITRNITDCELECLAQTWSEHCKHKIFNALISYNDGKKIIRIDSLFNTYIRKTTRLLSEKQGFLLTVFSDNAGIVDWEEDYAVAMKVETHNSPSALDPYGGAITGIVGVNRDILGCGLGAKPLFNIDVFCFGPPDFKGNIPGNLFHPRTVFRGVHKGIEHGGNRSGIPTISGSIVFDETFIGKPLVFCGTCGILPKITPKGPSHVKSSRPGDNIVMLGGRIGKDGIHGATFSSAELTMESPSSAVQIGDPFTQKKMTDFILKARDLGLYNNITDNGAGGLSSSVGEMAQSAGGAFLDLSKAPLKYSGLMPWEIFLSESQERMTLSVPDESLQDFLSLAEMMDTEATVLGRFTDDGYLKAVYGNTPVLCLPLSFLHDGLPRLRLDAEWHEIKESRVMDDDLPDPAEALPALLKSWNIASKEYWVRQYDHEVQGLSLIKPFVGKKLDGPSDGTSIRTGFGLESGIGIGLGLIPRYSRADTYHMVTNSVDEAVRNLICTGADPDRIFGLDNFCWPDPIQSEKTPDGKYKLAQLVRALQGLFDITQAYEIPLISGKDSMKNDYGKGKDRISILPTLLFTAIGRVENISNGQTTDFKKPGTLIAVAGLTRDELQNSQLYEIYDIQGGTIPRVDFKSNISLFRKIYLMLKENLLLSIHDISDGGLACALAESAIGGELGFEVDLARVPAPGWMHPARTMFSESPGRFVLSFAQEALPHVRKIVEGSSFAVIGEVRESRAMIFSSEKAVYRYSLDEIKDAFCRTLIF